jgi:gamma-glutamyl:cysteine ligase YbdK (ATP-grasp superfamily)
LRKSEPHRRRPLRSRTNEREEKEGAGAGQQPGRVRQTAYPQPFPQRTIRHGEAERAQALIWNEAYRLLTVREGDKVTRMPALQVVWRSLIASAAKGNVSALRAVVKVVQDIEAEARARRTGVSANKKLNKDVNEMSDEELMDILKAAQNDKS